jgi:hypothetical protein
MLLGALNVPFTLDGHHANGLWSASGSRIEQRLDLRGAMIVASTRQIAQNDA